MQGRAVTDLKKKGNIAETVRALAEPLARDLGLRLWNVQFVKEGASWILRIEIDKDGGVLIEDCENISRAIDPLLDEGDFIDMTYGLEVSSPGLNRQLVTPAHFEAMQGEPVIVRLYSAQNGKREFTGTLAGLFGDTLKIYREGAEIPFEYKNVASVKLDDFDL